MGKRGNPNLYKHGFGANPQNINKKGRPRKLFRQINTNLKDKGVEEISKQDLIQAYALIFNATQEDLHELIEDPETPYVYKLIIDGLKNKRFREQALKDMRDYAFGKSASNIEVTFKEQPLFPNVEHKGRIAGAPQPKIIDITPQDEESA